ncbi:MAG: hypothetical protein ABIL09_22610, partial [Gemmatimonadota bacterium]
MALLGAAVAALFHEALLGRDAFFVQDVMVQNYPFRDFFARALQAGSLPLWDAAVNCGFPLFAEGQAGPLYPPNLLAALLMPTWAAITSSVVLHLWLAAAATYGYLRALGCRPSAALTGGLTYGLSGYLVVRAMSPNFVAAAAWVPILFLLVELAWSRRQWLWLALVPGAVGLQQLAGHPQAAAYGLVALALYAGARAWGGVRLPLATALAILLGGALAAVQLVPTAELVGLSGRGDGVGLDQFLRMSLPPERLATLLLPSFFGNSGTGSYWGGEAGFFIQLCPYLGVLGLFLAGVAVLERRDLPTGFFAALAAAGLVLSLGKYTGFYELLYRVPGLASFRIPTRFLLWWSLAGAVLAGLGLETVLSGPATRAATRRRLAFLAALAGTAAALVWLNQSALGRRAGAVAAAYGPDLLADAIRCGAVLAAAAALCWSRRRDRLRRGFGALAPLVVFADLYSFGHGFNAVLPVGVYLEVPASARAILADLREQDSEAAPQVPPVGRARCVSVVSETTSPYDWHRGWMVDDRSYRAYPETLRMYTGGQYGLANALPGWSPLHLRRHWELTAAYPRLLPVVNAAYAVSYGPLSWPGLELIHTGQVRVYAMRQAFPRAYVVPRAVVLADPVRRLAYLQGGRFRPDQEVVLSAPAPAPASGAAAAGAAAP